MSEPAVVCDGLTRRFGELTAVDGLTLEIPRGCVFGFLGPNGAGKTTTIRLLLGLLEPCAGRARVLGLDPLRDGDQLRSRCGVLLEHDGLYTRLSALDNLDFAARIARLSGAEKDRRVQAMLATTGLRERQHEAPADWSRGMRQRLAVARALLAEPEMVFLDEPTAGLDPLAAAALRADLHRIAEDQHVTVFLTTHNLAEAERLCEQVGVLRQGRLLAVGRPTELRGAADRLVIRGHGLRAADVAGEPGVRAVDGDDAALELLLESGVSAAPLVRRLVESGAAIEEVRRGERSLEEAFFGLMEAP